MSGYEIIWDGISSTTIPQFCCQKITRQILGNSRGTFVEIPGRSGSWFFPEQPGRRKIILECFVLEEEVAFPTGRRDAVTLVADWLEIGRQGKLILGDDPTVFHNAVLIDPPDVDEWRSLATFELTFTAESYGYAINSSSWSYSAASGSVQNHDFSLLVPTYPIVEITPTGGSSITGFTLSLNGKILTYNTVLTTGSTVNVNSLAMSVLAGTSDDVNLTGAYDPLEMLMSGVTGSFPFLQVGTNEITVTKLGGDATGFTVNIIYRYRYRK